MMEEVSDEVIVDFHHLQQQRRHKLIDKYKDREDKIHNIVESLNQSQLRELVVLSASHNPRFVKKICRVAGVPGIIPKPTALRFEDLCMPEGASDWRLVMTYPPKTIDFDPTDERGINPFFCPYEQFNGVDKWFWISYGDGSGARCSSPPRDHPHKYTHDIEFGEAGFFVDGGNYRWLDDSENEEFLKSLKKKELPKEFELCDGNISFHIIIMRKYTLLMTDHLQPFPESLENCYY